MNFNSGLKLKDLSTPRLLAILKKLRAYTARPWSWRYGDSPGLLQEDLSQLEEVKSILATREHHPRGTRGRQVRQKERQNR